MTTFNRSDQSYMQMALTLAARGRGKTSPNPMVGAVVVNGGKVVGRGYHARAGESHAEVLAIREAGDLNHGATLYVTLEPCCHHGRTPPCVAAIQQAGLARVVAAMEDPNPLVRGRGIEELRKAGIQVDVGCLKGEARRLNEFFVTFHEQRRPFVTIKWAMSLCGRTAHDSRESRWITNQQSREHGHRLRSQHDGVLVGIGTVLSDDPMLNVRLANYHGPQPKRIVIDGDLSIPIRARLLREREKGEVILFTTPFAKREMVDYFEQEGCRVIVVPSKRRLINMRLVLDELARMGLMSVLIEGGRQIHTSLLTMGLVDKVVAFIAPKIIGGMQLRAPVEDLGLPRLENALVLRQVKFQTFGDDVYVEGYLREI
ncbi:MAG TPA: bifunctional diaminohydroxyphosphoribosylaminopyrimidine deaminase/5-amino-6-(5-phosphoribosylamino)uracil reductase RibD [Candidatus Sumerlaeota bacterium]|nr:bifunctional diaminohydroxyphosphoribosylaminopyrimidine deaminase/5-amino-6-(5-phosphoribosylamino)uracil reductase RibD [Candidatus Sumerlaeota bacterium]HOR27230.1 bifunctional diaminohydroxyphosphoribosylaminopyrimidine deaminase/5-amino-6-(5-phosphoribosylamino)uracil reductase RibD [Candidatus Sumerlaeota bacterium]